MFRRIGAFVVAFLIAGFVTFGWLGWGWYGVSSIGKNTVFIVPQGATLRDVADKLEKEGDIPSASAFLLRARLFGSSAPIRAGEFMLPAGASASTILATFQHGNVIRHYVTIPEGMPSILVYQRLMAEPLLTGKIPVPPEGSVLPQSYAFVRGESRAAVLARMQKAMKDLLAELWPKRAPDTAVKTPEQAVILASIVEKETAIPGERPIVAGLYSNRLRKGMMLQSDPTIIYPITKGKPLGRRIRESEIRAKNAYNTYTMVGLPKGPITNPGKASIEAVLHPAKTDALYMVANGKGGHFFSATLAQHDKNVAKWYAIRRARGQMK